MSYTASIFYINRFKILRLRFIDKNGVKEARARAACPEAAHWEEETGSHQ